MTRKGGKVLKILNVRVLRSFDLLRKGETFETVTTARTAALVAAGFLEVISGGESEAGPGAADQGDPGGEPEGAEEESSAGAEPGEDPSAG